MTPHQQLEKQSGRSGSGTTSPKPSSRLGYLVAITANAVLLLVVHRLVDWDLLPFLTDDFERLVPIISLSLLASMVVNGLRLAGAAETLALGAETASTAISLVATVRIFQVFPFHFDDEGIPWDLGFRVVLVLALIGTAVALIAVAVRLAGALLGLLSTASRGRP